MSGWKPGRWWRVVAEDGALIAETSDSEEARRIARDYGRPLELLWVKRDEEWREVTEPPIEPE